ncbi:NTP transferase domain-containing protein [Candidatus Saccharibacteria bacterium]|nr:NTP transferase domain-containing protein [Candidatus Saccharibacteria bacterium]
MITVIIAGGSGTRLWPLSTPEYPKHLLSLTGSKSLIRYTYERAIPASRAIYVVTEASHAHHVKEQLPELDEEHIIIEPARRGTANCIVAALSQVASGVKPNEAVAFLHADHYVRDTAGFGHTFNVASKVAEKSGRIVLVGVEPDHPVTGFGYIQKGDVYDGENFVFSVDSFKEKPDHQTAQRYLNSGQFLWNCGYFLATHEVFISAMKKHADDLFKNYEELVITDGDKEEFKSAYLGFENEAIDYALIEKVDDLLVVPASFDWLDLGSYGDLHKAVGSDEQGNYIKGGNVEIAGVENSIIRNDESKPLAVIGLDNVAVINTPQGILVTRKDLAQQVGEVSKRISAKKETK